VNYYRRYMGDYMRDTMHLSFMEHGAYTLMLDAQYSTEKALPTDYDGLYRICRAMTKPEQEAVRKVADEFFPVREGGRFNLRAEREIKVAQATIEKQRKSGAESSRKRWSTDGYTDESTDAPEIQPPTTNLQPPPTNPQPPTTKKHKAQAPLVLPDWIPADQWEAWIEARKKARKAPTEWAKKLAVAKLDELRSQGHHPAAVLAQSAFNGWADLFPPKGHA
jgi:uncharacterized protein YdaU (DUF1376 family)